MIGKRIIPTTGTPMNSIMLNTPGVSDRTMLHGSDWHNASVAAATSAICAAAAGMSMLMAVVMMVVVMMEGLNGHGACHVLMTAAPPVLKLTSEVFHDGFISIA
jgi:hypothetical protein